MAGWKLDGLPFAPAGSLIATRYSLFTGRTPF